MTRVNWKVKQVLSVKMHRSAATPLVFLVSDFSFLGEHHDEFDEFFS